MSCVFPQTTENLYGEIREVAFKQKIKYKILSKSLGMMTTDNMPIVTTIQEA